MCTRRWATGGKANKKGGNVQMGRARVPTSPGMGKLRPGGQYVASQAVELVK